MGTTSVMRGFAIIALTMGLAFAGCGGDNAEHAQAPALPAAVGEDLAEHAAAVAERLEAGDTCGAAHEADRLNEALRLAIADGDVPQALRKHIEPPVQRLVNEVNCEEPAPPEEGEEGEGGASCDELEAQKEQLDDQKKSLKDTIEDEEERKQREQEIEEEKKRVEEQLKECESEGD